MMVLPSQDFILIGNRGHLWLRIDWLEAYLTFCQLLG